MKKRGKRVTLVWIMSILCFLLHSEYVIFFGTCLDNVYIVLLVFLV